MALPPAGRVSFHVLIPPWLDENKLLRDLCNPCSSVFAYFHDNILHRPLSNLSIAWLAALSGCIGYSIIYSLAIA